MFRVLSLCACSLYALCAGALAGPRVAESAAIPRDLIEEMHVRGVIRVFVDLEDRSPPSPSAASRTDAVQDRVLSRLPGGCEFLHRYRFSAALALRVRGEDALESLAAMPEVARVSLDVEGRGALVESRALLRVDEVFALGVSGEGRVVAILDTGVDTDHPDLAGSVVHAHHFIGDDDRGPGAEDDHGHGTHVAGIIASRGVQSPRGIAPGAEIVSIKVLSANNRGFLTDWAAGVEHVIALHEDGLRIDVINMSLVSDALYPGLCNGTVPAFRNACEAAKDRGIVLMASSGDTGSTDSLRSPACYGAVVAVGSVSGDVPDTVSSFTDRNDLLDLLAPGELITSASLGGGGITVSGTSQSCAHASGVALLVRQVAPDLDPDGVLSVLASTGAPIDDAATSLTVPRIDALAALTELVGVEDCDESGRPDRLELILGAASDHNGNGVPDECDGPFYRRGDANADGAVDLADPVGLLGSLFGGDLDLACASAADINADGQVNLADAVYVLNFLFAAGEAPPAPYPDCGPDPAETPLGCVSHPPCG